MISPIAGGRVRGVMSIELVNTSTPYEDIAGWRGPRFERWIFTNGIETNRYEVYDRSLRQDVPDHKGAKVPGVSVEPVSKGMVSRRWSAGRTM